MGSIAEGPLTSLAFCWRLERPDGVGIALTSSDRDIVVDGLQYRSTPGVTPAAISWSLGLEPDSGEVAGALTADALTEVDLALGRWNSARVSLFAVDWTGPDLERILLLTGELGEVAIEGDSFSAELQGAAARLSKAPCPSTSSECRASFGDKRCRVDLAGRTIRTKVTSATDNLLDLEDLVDEKFLFGRLRYLGGENCGVASVILGVNGSQVSLRERPRGALEPGTLVQLREGCDKRFTTCVSRFQNGANFRGEPHLPGTDLLTRYPGG
ncbi:MAG TPA: DUF2163 domain-containing protein [Sphingomicrobium sp.]|nr:DUF2163 domain-containing protein [Sphingomicrobium sp.]